MRTLLHNNPENNLTIDLVRQTVSYAGDIFDHFDVSPTAKHNLMMGLGQIGLTMKHSKVIDDFELEYRANIRVKIKRQSALHRFKSLIMIHFSGWCLDLTPHKNQGY